MEPIVKSEDGSRSCRCNLASRYTFREGQEVAEMPTGNTRCASAPSFWTIPYVVWAFRATLALFPRTFRRLESDTSYDFRYSPPDLQPLYASAINRKCFYNYT
jgi:hypothetical protein